MSRCFFNRTVKIKIAFLLSLILAVTAAGCGGQRRPAIRPGSSVTPAPKKEVTEAPTSPSGEISLTGVLTEVNADELQMYFLDVDTGTEYKVAYTGGTDIQNKYGTILAASNLKPGEIYDVTCNKNGSAKTIYGAARAWTRSRITGFEVDEDNKEITAGASTFSYNSSVVVLSNTERLTVAELVKQDEVTLRGIDNTIYAVNVDKGHGYVKFTGIDSFIGGYASLGRSQLLAVTDGMLVTAQEGTFKVELQLDTLRAEKTVTVERDQEVSLDFSEYAAEATKNGAVNFIVTPADAVMAIDGQELDYSEPVPLSYGTHVVTLAASHYENYTEAFVVNKPYQTKVIDMTPKNANSATTTKSPVDGYTVQVTEPAGAALYVDSAYVGIVPCSFSKKAGNRTITLTRSGYATVSYTISVANAAGNLTYAFPEMERSSGAAGDTGQTKEAQSEQETSRPTSAGQQEETVK